MSTTPCYRFQTSRCGHIRRSHARIKRNAAGLLAASWIALTGSPAIAAQHVLGHEIEDTISLAGAPLRLNGAGYRKRGYFNSDITAIYCAQQVASEDALERLGGPKRIELITLQDTPGTVASKYFLLDFEATVTHDEFAQLIADVAKIGSLYSTLPAVHKGDQVNVDIVPGKGVMASLNGTPLLPPGAASPWFENEHLGKVLLRMFVGGRTPGELRSNLLGQSDSMLDRPAAPAGSSPSSRR
jgi:hypothetical protein